MITLNLFPQQSTCTQRRPCDLKLFSCSETGLYTCISLREPPAPPVPGMNLSEPMMPSENHRLSLLLVPDKPPPVRAAAPPHQGWRPAWPETSKMLTLDAAPHTGRFLTTETPPQKNRPENKAGRAKTAGNLRKTAKHHENPQEFRDPAPN